MANKLTVLAVATTNQGLSGLSVVADGVSINADGMRVLCVGQTNRAQNGPWVAHSGAWTRPVDYATSSSQAGTIVTASSGTIFTGAAWLSAVIPAVVDTNATYWACSPSWIPAPTGNSSLFLSGASTWATPSGGGGGGGGSNIDGGAPDSNYGGGTAIDGGSP